MPAVPRTKSTDRTKSSRKTAPSPEDKSSTPSPIDTSATQSKSGKISTTPENKVAAPSKNTSSTSEAKLPSPVKTPLELKGAQQSRSLKDLQQQEDSDKYPEPSNEKEWALKPASKSKTSQSVGQLRPQSGTPESVSEDTSAPDLRVESHNPMTTHSSTLTPSMRSPQAQSSTESYINWNFILLLFAYAILAMFLCSLNVLIAKPCLRYRTNAWLSKMKVTAI